MANVAVVGAQWGDEGKGKIVDWLSQRAEIVVRFQGGHNAGHTLVVGNVEYKMSLLPSGVVRPGKLSIIGNGVVVDPWALADEIAAMRAKGLTISPDNLKLADNAALILPSRNIGPLPVTLTSDGPGKYQASVVTFTFTGNWQLLVTVRTDAFDETAVLVPVNVHQ